MNTPHKVNIKMTNCQIYLIRLILRRNGPTAAKDGGPQKTSLPELAEIGYARIIAKKSVTRTSSRVVDPVGLVVVASVVGSGVGVGSALPDPGISPATADAHKTRLRTKANVNRFI